MQGYAMQEAKTKSGADAYREGIRAFDCPYDEGTDEFERWNREWDEAADEQSNGQTIPPKGSVVTNRYRAQYSEMGHPTHCGDAMATLLNSLCVNKAGTNLEMFEQICAANGVDLSKYNRTTRGWQGRLRMTGRNLLAKRVLANNCTLLMPEGWSPEHYRFDKDWEYNTTKKYKPKKWD
jgi:hypothetical protein